MQAEKMLSAQATLALVGVIASDLGGRPYGDPSKTRVEPSARSLPRPRRIMAVFLFYGALSLAAGFGDGPARLAAAAGGVTALAALVLGVSGRAIVDVLRRGSGLAAGAGPTGPSAAGVAPPANTPAATVRLPTTGGTI